MSNYIRKIVSGGKARFKDKELDLDLDLVYVTDQLIIMGFPAGGLEGFYRNRREDAKKFLDHRHRSNYWIFNFCPLAENSYDAAVFGGRVSRYPFPDHHAPPLPIMALAAREIRLWLQGSSERVAVLHCKAGKGRSGTLACAYLLSLDITPEPPRLQRSYTAKQWAKVRAEEWMDVVETDDMAENEDQADTDMVDVHHTPQAGSSDSVSKTDTQATSSKHTGSKLENVLALHTARRMKSPSSSSSSSSKSEVKKPKQGVSIPSQRRFLLYWSQLLSGTGPSWFWPLDPLAPSERPKVKMRQITIRLREANSAKMTLVKVVNTLLEKAAQHRSYAYGEGDASRAADLWVSLARYDDDFVEFLENWERHTRDEQGHFGKRRKDDGGHDANGEGVMHIFDDGKWDKGKMVRSFVRLGRSDDQAHVMDEEKGKVYTHVLKPLTESRWTIVQKSIKEDSVPASLHVPQSLSGENDDALFEGSQKQSQVGILDDGVILDAAREVRAKLYLGQVFMGWFWFIPAFHMSQDKTTHFRLGRKDVDFPLGAGAWIIDLDVEMEWTYTDKSVPPARQTSDDSRAGRREEPSPGGVLTGMEELVGGEGVESVVHAAQAARD